MIGLCATLRAADRSKRTITPCDGDRSGRIPAFRIAIRWQECANSGHFLAARRTGRIEPERTIPARRGNGRNAHNSGPSVENRQTGVGRVTAPSSPIFLRVITNIPAGHRGTAAAASEIEVDSHAVVQRGHWRLYDRTFAVPRRKIAKLRVRKTRLSMTPLTPATDGQIGTLPPRDQCGSIWRTPDCGGLSHAVDCPDRVES